MIIIARQVNDAIVAADTPGTKAAARKLLKKYVRQRVNLDGKNEVQITAGIKAQVKKRDPNNTFFKDIKIKKELIKLAKNKRQSRPMRSINLERLGRASRPHSTPALQVQQIVDIETVLATKVFVSQHGGISQIKKAIEYLEQLAA